MIALRPSLVVASAVVGVLAWPRLEAAQEFKRFGNRPWRLMEKSFKQALTPGVTLPFGSVLAGPFPHGTQRGQVARLVKWGMSP